MRKVILGLAISLDSFIEGPNGEYDWCFTDQDYGLNEFFKRVDNVFIRKKKKKKQKKKKITKEDGKDIWLFGGGSLTTSLMSLDLVDEFWLSVHPIILGEGKPLFHGLKDRTYLKLVETK